MLWMCGAEYLFILLIVLCCYFIKQKTAYEMRISVWSSDVGSSDLSAERLMPRILRTRGRKDKAKRTKLTRYGSDCPAVHGSVEYNSSCYYMSCHERVDRSEERRVGKESVSTWRSRWSA